MDTQSYRFNIVLLAALSEITAWAASQLWYEASVNHQFVLSFLGYNIVVALKGHTSITEATIQNFVC